MADRADRSGVAAGLGIGLAIAALLGVGLLIVLFFKRREGDASAPALDGDVFELPRSQPLSKPKVRAPRPAHTRFYSLKLSAERALPVAFGTQRHVLAVITNTGPAGSFAILNSEGGTDGFSLGAGESQEFRLSPKQSMYARGSVGGVEVSIAASEV